MINIKDELFMMQDIDYKNFHKKLIPNIDPDCIIGVRTPNLRKFAMKICGTKDAEMFMNSLPHKFYEENNLHAFLIEKEKDFKKVLVMTEKFLPFVDNWATCDSFMPKVFSKNKTILLPQIYKWIKSDHTYTVRYGIKMFMNLFLDSDFDKNYLDTVLSIKSDEYYVNMMIAWFFATALAKQFDETILYFKEKKLPKWVHNKAIQKAVESSRIDSEVKSYLKTLKIC